MISKSCESKVKEVIRVEDVVGHFLKLTKKGVNFITFCPFHDEKTPSFYVSPEKQIYKCFGCGCGSDALGYLVNKEKMSYVQALTWAANFYKIPIEEGDFKGYVLPVWKNITELSKPIVSFFEQRKISQKTLIKLKISEGVESMPIKGGWSQMNTIHFNYIRKEQLVNIKYRGKDKAENKKTFKLVPNAELILYNVDSLIGKKEAWITEGEPDCAALVECGYDNENSGVVSVPNGATQFKNNLIYIDNCIELFANIEKIHLALDNDANGRKLREELAERFGKERCDYIEFKDCKDANELLIKYDIQAVIDCCSNPINFPIEGVFSISDFNNEIDDMYVNGLDKGVSTNIEGFDLNIVQGYLTCVGGIPGHGKSEWVDNMTLNLVRWHDHKGAFYSPENKPTQLHFSKMARRIIGKHWDGKNRMTVEEKNLVKKWLEKKIWFIKPEKDFSLTSILAQIRALQIRHGLHWFVIDAWNKIEHKDDKTDTAGRALDEIAHFCELHNLHCFLVVHPTKMSKDKLTGKYDVPTGYSMSGSANFLNKADNIISVYRDFSKGIATIYRQKIKFDHWGKEGHSEYKYDYPSKRYYQEGNYDNKNWITGEYNKKVETAVAPLFIGDGIDPNNPPF